MSNKLFNLQEEGRRLHKEATAMKEVAAKENRQLNDEELEKFEWYFKDIENIDKQIKLQAELDKYEERKNDPFYKDGKKTGKYMGDISAEYDKALRTWMRFGMEKLTDEERELLQPGDTIETYTKGRGGKNAVVVPFGQQRQAEYYDNPEKFEKRGTDSAILTETNWIPTELDRVMNMTKKAYAGWMDACTEIRTPTGAPLDMPYFDDVAQSGALEAEGTDAIASSTDLTASKQTLNSYWYSSTGLIVGWSELRDIAFDESEFIYKPLTERLMRAINTIATTGDGSSKPQGIVTSAAVGEIVSASTTPTVEDMNFHLRLVDYAYHQGDKVGWMFNSNTMFRIAALVKSTTYNTELLWQPSLAAGIPSTLFGYRYWINNNMDIVGDNKKVMLFGDFSYQVNRFAGPLIISKLEERYAEKGQVGFLLSQYFDSETKIPKTSSYAPFKYMRNLGT